MVILTSVYPNKSFIDKKTVGCRKSQDEKSKISLKLENFVKKIIFTNIYCEVHLCLALFNPKRIVD